MRQKGYFNKAYRQENGSIVNEQVTGDETSSSVPNIRRDKALGWIPNARTPMNFLYNKVYESFYVENVSFLAVSKKKFCEEFHKEARRQYTVRQEVETVKRKTQQLDNTKNHSTAGYLLRENHTLKPHDSSIISMNINRIDELEKSVEKIENKVKSDLNLAFLSNGKIKTGRRTSKKFDEEIISELCQLKTKLPNTKSKLGDLERRASNRFQVDFQAFGRKSRSKKQNKHRAAKRKASRASKRKSEVLKKIAPGLKEDYLCEKRHIERDRVLKLNKREIKWVKLLLCDNDKPQLSDEARDFLSSMLIKNGSNAATGYQGDGDDDDDDDDDLDDEVDDTCILNEEDDCRVIEATAQIEESSDDDYGYGPYWESSCATQYLDHVSDVSD